MYVWRFLTEPPNSNLPIILQWQFGAQPPNLILAKISGCTVTVGIPVEPRGIARILAIHLLSVQHLSVDTKVTRSGVFSGSGVVDPLTVTDLAGVSGFPWNPPFGWT